jgi:hypothetical protein
VSQNPPIHFRPQTVRQRREVLSRIDAVEIDTMLSPPEPYLLHRMPAVKPLAIDVPTQRISRPQLAINTFSVYRSAGHGLRASLRHFFRVLARNS